MSSSLTVDAPDKKMVPEAQTSKRKVSDNGMLLDDEIPENYHKLMMRNALESPLLSLPAELRNRIFQIVHTGMLCLVKVGGNICSSRTYPWYKLFNETQLVCRQLRLETHNLEYKLNNTYFISGKRFEHMCRTKDRRLGNITNKVILFGDMGLKERPDEVLLHDMILNLAWKNPKARIIVKVYDLHFDTHKGRTLPGFLSFAGVILEAVRGKLRNGVPSDPVKKWRRRKSVKEMNAPNIRFYPAERVFDEVEFRRLASKDTSYMRNVMLPQCNYNMEAIVAEVRGWFKYGL